MSFLQAPLFTKTFIGADTFELNPDDGIKKYSIKVVSGTCSLLGTKKIQNIPSDAIELTEGQVFNGSSQNQACCFTLTIPPASIVEVAASSE